VWINAGKTRHEQFLGGDGLNAIDYVLGASSEGVDTLQFQYGDSVALAEGPTGQLTPPLLLMTSAGCIGSHNPLKACPPVEMRSGWHNLPCACDDSTARHFVGSWLNGVKEQGGQQPEDKGVYVGAWVPLAGMANCAVERSKPPSKPPLPAAPPPPPPPPPPPLPSQPPQMSPPAMPPLAPPLPFSPVPASPPFPPPPLLLLPAWVTILGGLAWNLPCRVPCAALDREAPGLQGPCRIPCRVLFFNVAVLVVALVSIMLLLRCVSRYRLALARANEQRLPGASTRQRKKKGTYTRLVSLLREKRKTNTYALVVREDSSQFRFCTNDARRAAKHSPSTGAAKSVLTRVPLRSEGRRSKGGGRAADRHARRRTDAPNAIPAAPHRSLQRPAAGWIVYR
jgi:hypothetical protein